MIFSIHSLLGHWTWMRKRNVIDKIQNVCRLFTTRMQRKLFSNSTSISRFQNKLRASQTAQTHYANQKRIEVNYVLGQLVYLSTGKLSRPNELYDHHSTWFLQQVYLWEYEVDRFFGHRYRRGGMSKKFEYLVLWKVIRPRKDINGASLENAKMKVKQETEWCKLYGLFCLKLRGRTFWRG